jgi:predicted methyltransferase
MRSALLCVLVLALACQAPASAPPPNSAVSTPSLPAGPPASPSPDPAPSAPVAAETPAPPATAPGVHKDFSNAAALSKHFDGPARDAWQHPAEVIAALHIEPGSTVADVGTGTGYFVEHLSRAVGPDGKVLALDVEPNMVAFVDQRAAEHGWKNVSARVVTPDDPGLAPSSVARILIVNTWHHIDDRGRYAQKLATALTPDGEIWIVDFTRESDLGPPAQHRLPAEQVVRELESGGLHAEVVPEHLPKQYIVRATRE